MHKHEQRTSCLSEVADGPDDGEEDGAAAGDVHEVEEVAPGEPAQGAGGGLRKLFEDHHGHVVQHLWVVVFVVFWCFL